MSDRLEPELERIAQMLADAGPLPDAPATLRERALAIPDEAPAAAAATDNVVPIAGRARRRPRTSILAGIAAVVAAIVIVPTAVVLHDGGGSADRVALAPRAFAPAGSGTATVATHGDGATISMHVRGLPAQPAGRTYEAWLGRPGDRRALGTFGTAADGSAEVSFTVSRRELGSYKWLWVTSEPAGGSAQPSTRTALWGAIT